MARDRAITDCRALCWTSLAASVASHAQILFGQTAGFSGQVAAGVKETADGALLYIDAINAKGGVNGQKIGLTPWTTSSTPSWWTKTRAR